MTRGSFPDLARADGLIRARGGSLGQPLHLLEETTSTNDEAKHAAKRGAPHGSTWVTEVQSAGRGRQGRTWLSAGGENLLFSVLWRLPCPPGRLPLLPLAAGVAVCEAVRSHVPGVDIRLKWPNDVVLVAREGAGIALKKLAGILVETCTAGGRVESVVIGVGINVLSRELPPDLLGRATSLALLSARPLDRAHLLADVLVALDRTTSLAAARGLGLLRARIDEWDALRGEPVRSDLGSGVARGVDDEGRLVVESEGGARTVWGAGEVHLNHSA